MLNYGKQSINEDDIKAVIEILKSDYLTQGPAVKIFEDEVSNKVGAKHGIAVNSATSALHIACKALGLKEGDWLWTSPNSYVASSNCGLYCGAKVDFVDIDSSTYNICAEKLEMKLEHARQNDRLPKIVIPVHMCGQSSNMKKISFLSKKYGFSIVEDASHAIGAKYKDKYVGSCEYSDISVFSFHPVKIITTGEGGMALTNNAELADKMQLLRSHGVTRNEDNYKDPIFEKGPWYYQQLDLGFNYRMCDFQAALGTSQLKRLDKFVERRNEIAMKYDDAFKSFNNLSTPFVDSDCYSSFHLYIIQVKFSDELSKSDFFKKMKNMGINLNCHYIPIHTQPYYKKIGFEVGDFPVSEEYYRMAATIPLHASMSDEEVDHVIESIGSILS